jgi:hypothetical protein
MGHQIIRQPDGLLAVFSSVVDDWVITDATADELVDWYAEEAAVKGRERTRKITDAVLAGEARKIYYQFTMTWDEAEEQRKWQAEPASSPSE